MYVLSIYTYFLFISPETSVQVHLICIVMNIYIINDPGSWREIDRKMSYDTKFYLSPLTFTWIEHITENVPNMHTSPTGINPPYTMQ